MFTNFSWRRQMIKRYLKAGLTVLLKPLEVKDAPIHVIMEPTTFCNLKCIMCKRDKYISKPKHMKFAEFKTIIDKINPRKLTFSGFGEPLIHPEIKEIITYAKQKKISLSSVTNFVAPKISFEDLVESGIDLLEISIDGATSETYYNIRKGNYFAKIIENIEKIQTIKEEFNSPKPYLRFQFVIQKDNISEISQVVTLASRLKVDAIYFKPLFLAGINERRELLVGELSKDKVEEELLKALKFGKHTNIKTNLNDLIKNILPGYWELSYLGRKIHSDFKKCPYPWFSVYITVEGKLHPCCFFTYFDESMGNILTEDLEAVWNSEKYQKFRKVLCQGKAPHPRCEECIPQNIFELIMSFKDILPGWLLHQ